MTVDRSSQMELAASGRQRGAQVAARGEAIAALQKSVRAQALMLDAAARRERLLCATLSWINDSAYAFDRDGCLLFANKPLLDRWGLRLEEAVGKSFADLGYPRELARKLHREVTDVFETNKVVTAVSSYPDAAGLHRHYEYIFSPALGEDGTVDFVVGTSRDITERKRAADRLSESHRHLRDLMDGLGPDIFVGLLTPDGVLVEVNRAPLIATGLTREDVVGKPFADAHWWTYSADIQQQLRAAIARAALGEPSRYDVRTMGADGQLIDIDFSLQPMRGQDGAVAFLIPSATVITERKRAQFALQQSLEKFQTLAGDLARANADLSDSELKFHQLADNILDVFFIVAADERTAHYVSPAYERIWGRPVGSPAADPQRWREAIVPADRAAVAATLATLGAATPAVTLEYRIARPDGSERWIHSHVAQVRGADGELLRIVGIARDITEHKHSEAQLHKTHALLLDSSRRAGMAEVATNVLHNVGNVLNSVNISASLALESVRSSRAPRMAHAVALMREHVEDLGDYITHDAAGRHIPAFLEELSREWVQQQRLLVAELESLRDNVDHIKQIVAMQQSYANISGTAEIVDVTALVEDALRVQSGSMSEHGVRLVREFEDVPPINVAKYKVLPILVNLVRNAKHACMEKPDSDRCITLRVAPVGAFIRISVIDDGAGIAPENMTRIFSHGFTTRKDGHGFGLHSGAIAAAELGGRLFVHSDGVGKGATFTLELPMQPPEGST